MAKYLIKEFVKTQTKTGKFKADATLVDENNVETTRVTVWPDFPNFETLQPHMEVEGSILISRNGKYTNKNLYPMPKFGTPSSRPMPSQATSTPQVKSLIAEKNKGIEKAQERKSDSIKMSGAARDSVLMVTTFYPEIATIDNLALREETLRNKVTAWRKWFIDNYGDDVPFV